LDGSIYDYATTPKPSYCQQSKRIHSLIFMQVFNPIMIPSLFMKKPGFQRFLEVRSRHFGGPPLLLAADGLMNSWKDQSDGPAPFPI
tara:strand:- start:51 stop:311 length:261 start_codon:yes stop_codon:yes gene_type:complete